MFDYVFFDLDGTLTDSGEGIMNSVQHVLEHWGIEEPDRGKLRRFVGPPLVDSFAKFYGFPEERMSEMLRVYREYYTDKGMFENEVYEGIPELLKGLRAKGSKLVVATSKPELYSVEILKHFGLFEYFEYVSGATMDEKRVKKDEIIEFALNALGITDRSRCVMVGDREHDIIGAKHAGIASAGVLYGYGDLEELLAAGADFIADTPADLLMLL